MVNFPNPFLRESVPLQADGIQSIGVGSAFGGGLRKGQHIARDGGATTDKGMRSNADEVMHRAQCPYRCPVPHGYVPAQRGCVRHDDVAANLTIVGDVGIGHDQVVGADPGASCGAMPIEVKGKKTLSAPILVGPSMATCETRRQPSPSST